MKGLIASNKAVISLFLWLVILCICGYSRLHHQSSDAWMDLHRGLLTSNHQYNSSHQQQQQQQQQQQHAEKSLLLSLHAAPNNEDVSQYKVAFVVVVAFLRCGKSASATYSHVLDGLAVLSESIHQHHPSADLIIIAHPSTKQCKLEEKLSPFGFQFDHRDIPVAREEIENQEYVQIARHDRAGCCGLREFIKLYCYTLTDYDVVVHLDHDTLLKKNLNDLIRVMMGAAPHRPVATYRNEHPAMISNNGGVDFIYTRDYRGGNLLHPHDPFRTGVQGGFFMVKPSLVVYEEMKTLIRRGNFTLEHGWEGSGIGQFYGDAQIQGFLAYYYYSKSFRGALEVDRCIYNTVMEDDYLRDDGSCMTNETTCQDCRESSWDDLVLLHYTMCTKPWTCMLPKYRKGDYHLCKVAHREWFRLRRDLELKLLAKEENNTTSTVSLVENISDDWTYGYCTEYGHLDTKKDSYKGLLKFG